MLANELKPFDILGFIKNSCKLGMQQDLAEFQARQIEQIVNAQNQAILHQTQLVQEQRIEIETLKLEHNHVVHGQKLEIEALKAQEPASKKDLEIVKLELQKEIEVVRKEIVASRNSIIIWVGGLLGMSGILQHFFR